MSGTLTIGKLAKAVGIETIRFHEREGLLAPAANVSWCRTRIDVDIHRGANLGLA